MGKGISFKKKNKVLTQRDIDRKRKELEEEHERFTREMKNDITASATELAGCLYNVALHHVYGFGNKRLVRLNDEIERINAEIVAGNMTWWDVRDEASELGFVPANEYGLLEERPAK